MAPKSSKVEATSSVAAAAVEVSAVASVTEQIVSVLAGQLLLNYPLNKARLEQEIGDKVAAKRPIDMLLPAFPCKSINTVITRDGRIRFLRPIYTAKLWSLTK